MPDDVTIKDPLRLPKLTDRHRRFAERYFLYRNATEAYQHIWKVKKPRTAEVGGGRVLHREDVQEYLRILEEMHVQKIVDKRIAKEEDILVEETKIALNSLAELFDENGTMKDFKDWPKDIKDNVKEVKFTDDPSTGRRVIQEIKFYDKGQALGRLERVYGMNAPDKKEVNLKHDIRAILIEIDGMDRGRLPNEND